MADPVIPPIPTLADLKPRDYREPLAGLAGNVKTFIETHPDSFECLLYQADPTTPETVAANVDVVGSIESTERTLTYKSPEPTMAFIVPDANPRDVEIDGDDLSSDLAEAVVLLIAFDPVPQQSIIQYREMVNDSDTPRDVTLYVHHIDQVGSGPGVCKRYYCMPMQKFTDLVP